MPTRPRLDCQSGSTPTFLETVPASADSIGLEEGRRRAVSRDSRVASKLRPVMTDLPLPPTTPICSNGPYSSEHTTGPASANREKITTNAIHADGSGAILPDCQVLERHSLSEIEPGKRVGYFRRTIRSALRARWLRERFEENTATRARTHMSSSRRMRAMTAERAKKPIGCKNGKLSKLSPTVGSLPSAWS
jgi:hypothetical protein